ncbi:zf-HC2 domain-containing protein [Paenibacillus thalictri]|uniref:Anti-sigma-W factor RsiW n=1 Tax=Paenibacillus thalictri TaxID=2527873 RepID=A0A4Q9DGK9_9BACL|nr:zf-HC2 domain-containing protein [Paenibacillus thalictri]TBL68357.1 anti-sigma factor [Paenibacillus thalictri]
MECSSALPLIHEYLDGDLAGEQAAELKRHLLVCPSCNAMLRQFEMTEAMVKAGPPVKAPDDLKDRIMLALPPIKDKRTWLQWVRRHPAVSVAAVFVLVMMSSYVSLWNEDHELVVKGNAADLEQVVIKGDTVYVPQGHKLAGNLTVQHGKMQVDGEIDGNVVVIDGSMNLASTAHISGQVTKVDEAFEWMWFKFNEFFSQISK